IDRVIQLEAAVFDQTHGGHRRDGLADGSRLEGGGDLNRAAGFDVGGAVSFGPVDFEVAHHRDAYTGDMETSHQAGDGFRVEALMVRELGGFNTGDDGGGVVRDTLLSPGEGAE